MPFTLLIQCTDEPGLVAKITGSLFSNNLNIISNHEFVERKSNRFFMRTEFSGVLNEKALLNELKLTLPVNVDIKLKEQQKKDIVILVTKEQHCLGDLLVRYAFDELQTNIKCVIGNHSVLENLTNKFDVPFHFISHIDKTIEEYEIELLKVIKSYNPEYIVLAKFMRILSNSFVKEFSNKIINIHHSFLPAFVGANPYLQAYDRGVKIIGATAHFVTNNLDEGPIIAQSVIPTTHSKNPKEMAQAGRDVEKIVLASALQLVLNDRVFVEGNRTIIFD